MSASFAALNDAHDDLEELFALHQECLLIGRIELAGRLLRAYRALIELHIRHEEDRVLPIYARAEDKRWPEELFTGQHVKIGAFIDRIEAAMSGLAPQPGWRRRVIEVLEIETTLKHLIEHHHLAEDEAFYPTADAHGSEAERAELTETCRREWLAAMSEHEALARDARSILDSAPLPD